MKRSRIVSTREPNFLTLRQENLFYIDKTKFIKDWWIGHNRVTLITRPRRFGKTLMLDTIKTFFSQQFTNRSDLFEGLAIWEDEKFRKLQVTLPVIFLSFANIKSETYEESISKFKELFVNIYDEFRSQLQNINLSMTENEHISSVHKSM
ncbi:MAG: AAA family ATPase [Desulfovibrionaceae bacterium]|nr:AAA family ATPase [Desulfovibrionaceae bacterium]